MQISKLVLKVSVVMMSGLISTVALASSKGMNQDTTACLHAPQKNKPRERGNKVAETAKSSPAKQSSPSGTRNSGTQK